MSTENVIVSLDEQLMANIDEALKAEVTSRHSYFQLKYFVIGKEPTTQAKMWQCLRELKTRRESIVAIEMQIEESKDQLELLDIQIEEHKLCKPSDDIQFQYEHERERRDRKYEITGKQLKRQAKAARENLAQLEEQRVWLLQEARFFLESFKNLEKVEPLKDFDDLVAQKQYWGEKLAQKINLKMLLQSPLDMELIETALALPDDIPVKTQMVNRLNNVQNQLIQLKEECKKKLKGTRLAK
jgi:hypothetical protein